MKPTAAESVLIDINKYEGENSSEFRIESEGNG